MTHREELSNDQKNLNWLLGLEKETLADMAHQQSKIIEKLQKAAKAQAVPQWIPVSERLPDEDYGYFLVTRKHWRIDDPRVCCSFYIKDRDRAKREYANGYSRKYQGKDSIHFECSRGGFIITHWMPFPAAPEQNK